MEHDELGIPLHRFTVKELHRMRETSVLAHRARVELLDGILVDMHRPSAREVEATRRIAGVLAEHFEADVVAGGPVHPDGYATFDATIMVERLHPPPSDAVIRRQLAVELGPYSRIRVDVGVCRRRAGGNDSTPARGEDVLLAVDVAASPDRMERLRWPLSTRWGVMTAWLVDLDRDEIRTLRRTPAN